MAGEKMKAAVAAQPEWLAQVPVDRRLPDGRVAVVGCGTSFHAAQTSGSGIDALEFLLRPPEVDVLVLVSHEGTTPLTIEAAKAFSGEKWLVTAQARERPGRALRRGRRRHARRRGELLPHRVATPARWRRSPRLRGEDVSWLPAAVAEQLAGERLPVSAHERWLITGAGRDWPTAQEAALKLREGVYLAAEAHQLEELLHGHLAAVDEGVRCFVLEGEGRAAARAADAAGALRELGCDVTLVPTRHPVVDIVPFQLLTLDLAAERGVDPDLIRWDDPRWKRARDSYR